MNNHSSHTQLQDLDSAKHLMTKAVDKHEKILTAAMKIFAKKGFFSARISDIAKEAKVADGTIYLYFNNKNEILLSVFEEEFGKLIEQVQLATAGETDSLQMLDIFAVTHLQAMKRNKYLAEVIQIELRQTNKIIKDYRNTVFSSYIDIVAGIIRQGQQQGIFRQDIQPDIAKRAFFGALDEVSRVWNLSLETHYTVEEASYQLLSIFQNGLRATTE